MPEKSIYIFREKNVGFTLFGKKGERMEFDQDGIDENFAVKIFSDLYGCRDVQTFPIEQADGLFEGIDSIILCRNGEKNEQYITDLFAPAVKVMMEEVDKQERVAGYFNVLSQCVPKVTEKFKKFFVTQLKETRNKPTKYCFPEYSNMNPYFASGSQTGGEGRVWGLIQDRETMDKIISLTGSSLSGAFGDVPLEKRFSDNYFITSFPNF